MKLAEIAYLHAMHGDRVVIYDTADGSDYATQVRQCIQLDPDDPEITKIIRVHGRERITFRSGGYIVITHRLRGYAPDLLIARHGTITSIATVACTIGTSVLTPA